ncbi:ATP-binding protein [Streptomyces sp. NPDC019531]|uniref:ATP-binding protein n=1 Tax=Streptomyces sp. NPDC019531 TaxID=3365062 RepID=UPI00384ECE16
MRTSGAAGWIGAQVQAARDLAFTGREAELRTFRSALSGAPDAPSVLYLHGPGGVGKSMLLRRFATEARTAGREVVEVDGRIIEPTPEAFEKEAEAVFGGDRAVLLIDTFECCQRLERWLRDRFLIRLPAGAVVVIAGRQAPEPGWTSDPGWAGLLRTAALRNLAPDEVTAFLHASGVPPQTHAALLNFTGGHPLALALAAAVALKDEGRAADWEPSRDVIETLLPQLIGDVPSPVHRRALEVCAHAYVTTETLLRAVIGDAAVSTFAWLRELPFVESSRQGLFPHDVVRKALEADLRWRDPEGYAELHHRLRGYLFDRIRTAPERGMLYAVGEFMYLYRSDRYMSDFNSWRGGLDVTLGRCEPADHAAVLALTADVLGTESVALARYWLDRQPEAFKLCEDAEKREIVGYSAWLRLTEPCAEEVDPVVSAAWAHARSASPLREGEHLAVSRFHVTPPAYGKGSPITGLHQWRCLAEIARAGPRLAWTYIAILGAEYWRPYLTSLGLVPIAGRPRVDDHTYTLFALDWRVRPIRAWAERKTDLMLSHVPGLPGLPCVPETTVPDSTADLAVLSRPEFDAAVRDALRELRHPEKLAVNPLTRSRLTVEHGRALLDVLTQAVEALREERGRTSHHRAVAATYLRGATTQEAAATRLGVPFGTYRRHLAGGVERICDALWHQEIYGTGPDEQHSS